MNWIEERKQQILEERRQAEIDASLLEERTEERAKDKNQDAYDGYYDDCVDLIKQYNKIINQAKALEKEINGYYDDMSALADHPASMITPKDLPRPTSYKSKFYF